MKYGCTFSPRQLETLGLDPIKSLKTICKWPIAYIRVGCYWDEIEPTQNKYQTERIRNYLKIIEQSGKKAVVVVGMKSPRWPEFYIPEWAKSFDETKLQTLTLKFIKTVVKDLRKFSVISHWQIENEPFDESGPDNIRISDSFIEQEIKLVRSLDNLNDKSRPCVITVWGNDTVSRETLIKNAQNCSADIIGLDVYYKQYNFSVLGKDFYRGPTFTNDQIKSQISKINKPLWIAELQAEPWEKNEQLYQADNPLSISISKLRGNLKKVSELNPEVILFWGVEYWLWRQEQGDSEYVKFIETLN